MFEKSSIINSAAQNVIFLSKAERYILKMYLSVLRVFPARNIPDCGEMYLYCAKDISGLYYGGAARGLR